MYEAVKKCIGLVEYHYDKKITPCSGSMLLAGSKVVIATAAHCIFDWKEKKFHDEIYFSPYLFHSFKKYKVLEAYISKRWANNAEVEFDTGFLVIEDRLMNDFDIYDYAISPLFNQERNLHYICGGFGYNPLRKSPYFFQGKSVDDTYFNSTLIGIKHKVKNGMSGGPWIIEKDGKYYQNSLVSFTNKKCKNFVWAPYWGKEIETIFLRIKDGHIHSQNESNIVKFIF